MATSFYLSPKSDKKGDCPIRVSVSIHGTRLISTVGYNIHPDKWSSERQEVKKGMVNAKGIPFNIINLRLREISTHFDRYELNNRGKPSVDELANELAIAKGEVRRRHSGREDYSLNSGPSSPVVAAFDVFVREESRSNGWTMGTMQCWHAFRSHLLHMGDNLQFSFFDENGIKRFVAYLRTDRKMEEKTVQKHYSNLRWFLNWCIRQGYCSDIEISHYRPRFQVLEKPVVFLTTEELSKLYSFEIPSNGTKVKLHRLDGSEYEYEVKMASSLEKTRDLFVFCASTSLRYSDMANLKKTDRVGDMLYVTSKKTSDTLNIPLNDISSAILDKYKEEVFPNGLALPVISNQKMNDYIKILCMLCEFNAPITRVGFRAGQRYEETYMKWELIGTHAGRRTLICSALSMGIAPNVVMKWTGHHDYKSMRPYIDITNKTSVEAMRRLNAQILKGNND